MTTTLAAPAPIIQVAIQNAVHDQTAMLDMFGFSFNLPALGIVVVLIALLYMFYRIQKSAKLDFADMVTKDGKSVSLTKVLQLLGGITATWVVIKLTIGGGLTEPIFGLYLTYVGAVEGYSKYVAAKYGYNEKSVRDGAADTLPGSTSSLAPITDADLPKPPKS